MEFSIPFCSVLRKASFKLNEMGSCEQLAVPSLTVYGSLSTVI